MNSLTEEYLAGIKEIEEILLCLGFHVDSFEEKGFAYFITYSKGDIVVRFLFGPSGWDIEMIICTSKGKFAFKDLLKIPAIVQWVNENRYTQENGINVRNELLWNIELLKISLPFVE